MAKSSMQRLRDAAHHVKALKAITHAALTGGLYAAAAQIIKHYWPQIVSIALILILLPVIVLLCLPAMLFGFGSVNDADGAAMNAQAATVRACYDRYIDYYNDRIEQIKNIVSASVKDYDLVLTGTPMEKNWFIALHSVSVQNDLSQMNEANIRGFVEQCLSYMIDNPQEGGGSDDTHEAPDESATPPPQRKAALTIQYLTPDEYMTAHNMTEADRNWALLLYNTMQQN